MKIAILGDLHAGARNDSEDFNNYFLDFFDKSFFPYIKKHRIDTCIQVGDVFDRRTSIKFSTLHSWKKNVFSRLNDCLSDLHIICGNHDTSFKNTNEVNSLETLLCEYDKFYIYTSEPKVLRFGSKQFLLCPWIAEENKASSIKAIESSLVDVCIGHFDIIGFEMHPGTVNTDHGFEPSMFDKFNLTLSGHYHSKSAQGSIHYVGTPYALTWGEYGVIKGFHVLDTDTLELEFIPNPTEIFQKIEYIEGETEVVDCSKKIVRVIVKEKKSSAKLDAFLHALKEFNPIDVSVIDVALDVTAYSGDTETTKDTMEIVKDYIDSFDEIKNKKRIENIFRELYTEAISNNSLIE